jgi:quinol monooxygenase YgiN
MYARSTTIMADPSTAEQGIALVREQVWPAVREMDGCLGLSLLVDRSSGRSILTTSWETAEAMRASADLVRAMRQESVTLVGGGEPLVEEWEILSMHRLHHTEPGTWVRTAWSRVPGEYVDRAIDFYRTELLPQIEQLDGFTSASLMVDRAAGRGVLSVAYETREALEQTRDKADYLRAKSSNEANVETLDVAELELAVAHLHVPELV